MTDLVSLPDDKKANTENIIKFIYQGKPINIKFDKIIDYNSELLIYNSMGQLIKTITDLEQIMHIDFGTLPFGVYVGRVEKLVSVISTDIFRTGKL